MDQSLNTAKNNRSVGTGALILAGVRWVSGSDGLAAFITRSQPKAASLPGLAYTPGSTQGTTVAKANYKFDKRQRDLAKQKKQEDKRLKKLARKAAREPAEVSPPLPRDETP